MAVGYTLRFLTKEGREAEFAAFLGKMVEVVKANDRGCQHYELYQSVEDPRRFSFFERWETEEDVKAHAAKPHFKEFGKMQEMLEGPPEMFRHAE